MRKRVTFRKGKMRRFSRRAVGQQSFHGANFYCLAETGNRHAKLASRLKRVWTEIPKRSKSMFKHAGLSGPFTADKGSEIGTKCKQFSAAFAASASSA